MDNDIIITFVNVLCVGVQLATPKLVCLESSSVHKKIIGIKSTSFQDSM